MAFIIFLLIISIAFLVYYIKTKSLTKNINQFIVLTAELHIYYLTYQIRKILLEHKGYSYDTVFVADEKSDTAIMSTEMSQKELMALMYKRIEQIDLYITKVPNEYFENTIDIFYELRRDIRTEKLSNEGTTF